KANKRALSSTTAPVIASVERDGATSAQRGATPHRGRVGGAAAGVSPRFSSSVSGSFDMRSAFHPQRYAPTASHRLAAAAVFGALVGLHRSLERSRPNQVLMPALRTRPVASDRRSVPTWRYTSGTRNVYSRCVSRVRTNIEIEDTFLQTVMDRYGLRTKTE